MTFNYEKVLEEFYDNYFNTGWASQRDLRYTWEVLKGLEEVPDLNKITEMAGLNKRVLRRKLRKILPRDLYDGLMKDLKIRKRNLTEKEFEDLVATATWKTSPYDDKIVLPKDLAIITEKDGTIWKRIRTPGDGWCWPKGRGPHIIDRTKLEEELLKHSWDEYFANPETKWKYISHERKFDKRTTVGKVLSKKRDELREAASKKSKITSERFTKMTPADFDRLSKEFKRREEEIEREQAKQAAAEDEFHEEE